MLNGQGSDLPGDSTCFRHNGQSVPDYMLLRGSFKSFGVRREALGSLSDHAALYVTLPWVRPSALPPASRTTTVYKWVEGTSLSSYSESWRAWNRHTDTESFAQAFHAIIDQHESDVEQLATATESFLID